MSEKITKTEELKMDVEKTEKESKMKPILTKSLFILMILVIIIILAFSVLRFLPLVFSSFASVGNVLRSPFDKGLVLKVNEPDLTSDEVFRLNFIYEPEEEGYYSLSYDCAPNLVISVANQDSKLECNRSYTIAPSDKFIDLKATLDKENFYTESKINVAYLNRAREEVDGDSIGISVVRESTLPISDLSGSATISSQGVSNQDTTGGTTAPTTSVGSTGSTGSTQTTTQAPVTRTINYVNNTPADLRITNAVALNDTTISFDVANIGGKASGNWYFIYTIPNERAETSPIQMSLNPNEIVRLTLRFIDIESGNVAIVIDPSNHIRENSETNNSATVYLRGDGGSSSYSNNNYYYDDYYYNDYYNDYDYDRNDDADLVIKNLEVGRMSGSRFVEDDEIDEDDDAAVRFEVANIGGESTGRWRFEIDETPYDGSNNDYRSGRQNSLRPGESVILTVEFENPDDGRYRIEVDIDSDDDVDEENERNNDDSEVLEVER